MQILQGGSIFTLLAICLCEVQDMSQTGYTNMTCHFSCCKLQQRCQTAVLEAYHRVLGVIQHYNPSLNITTNFLLSHFPFTPMI